jgi:hypothetical protein
MTIREAKKSDSLMSVFFLLYFLRKVSVLTDLPIEKLLMCMVIFTMFTVHKSIKKDEPVSRVLCQTAFAIHLGMNLHLCSSGLPAG